jgi:myosin heavy chain 6/7
MAAEKDIKKAAGICLETVALDPEMYRLGHTKARTCFFY